MKSILLLLTLAVAQAALVPLPSRSERQAQARAMHELAVNTHLLPPRLLSAKMEEGAVVLHYNNAGIDAEKYEVQRRSLPWRWRGKGFASPQEVEWRDEKPARGRAYYRMRAISGERKGAWTTPIIVDP